MGGRLRYHTEAAAHASNSLVRVGVGEVFGQKVSMYVEDLERDARDPSARRWNVIGDFGSMKTAESHELYRSLDHYLPPGRRERRGEDKERSIGAGDILFSDSSAWEDWAGLPQREVPVLSGKTQGYPCHVPLLAAAMVVEHTFPQAALASGDIGVEDALKAQTWARSVLNMDISLPLRCDAPRLVSRLEGLIPEVDLLSAAQELFCGPRAEAAQAVLMLGAVSRRETVMLDALSSLEGPRTAEAEALFTGWLNATEDLPGLMTLACLDEKGPCLAPQEFILGLAKTGIAGASLEVNRLVETIATNDSATSMPLLSVLMQGIFRTMNGQAKTS